jgi:hypothetical protein
MIKIFCVHAKRTDFLRLHVEQLRFFCEDQFEYFCIDNFPNAHESEKIKDECEKLNINYVRFLNYEITGTAWDHAPSLNSIKTISNDNDINVILEFDVFLINNFSFVKYIEDYNIAGIYQQRDNFEKEYLAPFVIIVNKNSEFSTIDFNAIPGDSCDVGGNTRFYIKNKNVKWMNHTTALIHPNDSKSFITDYDPSYGSQVIENCFLHYYRGSNWDGRSKDYEDVKTDWLKRSLDKSRTSDIINHNYLSKYHTKMSHAFRHWNGNDDKLNSKLNPYLNEN